MILPDQLVLAVVGVTGRVHTVKKAREVAVLIVGVADRHAPAGVRIRRRCQAARSRGAISSSRLRPP